MRNSSLMFIILFTTFSFITTQSMAQITNVELKNSSIVISRAQLHTVTVAVCGSCKVAGYNGAYVVVYSGPKALIYNHGGQVRGKLQLRNKGKIIDVGKKEILVEDALGYYLYYDFTGAFLRRARKNL